LQAIQVLAVDTGIVVEQENRLTALGQGALHGEIVGATES
jgi:hypothetical protein